MAAEYVFLPVPLFAIDHVVVLRYLSQRLGRSQLRRQLPAVVLHVGDVLVRVVAAVPHVAAVIAGANVAGVGAVESKPPDLGGFAGAGAAPLTGIPVDVMVTGDGSVNLTLSDVRLKALRIG